MDYITKDTLDKYIKGKSVIEFNIFVELFEKEFGIVLPFKDKVDFEQLTEGQRTKMTKAIFTNDDVLEQLRKASVHHDYIEDDNEALNIINEARHGK
ncbi:hypothetical protein VQL36_04615 [Chengkuizengella sp. SCS-71B]|uniref:hypothetical protein n=1 Tax=Chengkuizengella sp. SCS-71B TaxID=3115290 RepID=UPI0032C21B77